MCKQRLSPCRFVCPRGTMSLLISPLPSATLSLFWALGGFSGLEVKQRENTVSFLCFWCLWFQPFVSSEGQLQPLALSLTPYHWTVFMAIEGTGDCNTAEAQGVSVSYRGGRHTQANTFPRKIPVERQFACCLAIYKEGGKEILLVAQWLP